ncbi:MAG: tripartite tricarboxylate transporter substrate binding protein [Pseudomonadota bacterium]
MTKILRKVNNGVMSAFCAALVLGLITILLPEAFAQAYPTKPIRIVVGTAPGGGGDIVSRLLGGKLAEALGQQIIVDNRDGAGGRISAEIAARSAPDGYTLLMITGQFTIVDAMYKNLKYNLVKDFSPISLLGTVPFILAINPSVPATSVKELVTLAKSRPGVLKYGSGGSGSGQHLSTEIFKFMTGTDILHVPYKAPPAALTNTLTGEVDMTFQPVTACLPVIKSGKLRALGVTSHKRTTLAPDLPSISETVPGYEYTGFYGLVAPTKTPPAILSKLNIEVVKALNTPAVRERMTGLGIDTLGTSQNDFASFISTQLEKMRKAVKLSGTRVED